MTPAEVERHSDTGMQDTVRERNETITRLNQHIGDIDLPSVEFLTLPFMVKDRTVAHDNTCRVIKLRDIRCAVVIDLDNRERGICHAAFLTYRECIRNGFHRI